jgi:hypothetical protein
MNSIWKQTVVALALAVGACVAQAQLPPATVMEASIETNGNGARFPASSNGTVVVQGCPQCLEQSLQLDAHSRFFINGQETTLAKLTSAALGATNKPLTIHFRLRDKVVTRVDLTVFAS